MKMIAIAYEGDASGVKRIGVGKVALRVSLFKGERLVQRGK